MRARVAALDVHWAPRPLRGSFMRETYRPMIRLALFGTYTLVAVGIGELRKRLTKRRMPLERMPLKKGDLRRRQASRRAA
jgi:hypothetical protein